MSCGCIIPSNDHVLDLASYMDELAPIVWGTLQNVEVIDNQLYRNGGTPDSNDAFGFSSQFVEGAGCGLWECRQFFDNDDTNNTIFMVLEDEFGTANRYGWSFTNQTVSWRRSPHHGTTTDFPVYYGPEGGPAPPDQVGYNVGFRFGVYYYNGTVWLYENDQWTNDTNDFFGSGAFSYVFSGLPTDRRWHLKVYVFPDASTAHSPLIFENIIVDADSCGDAAFVLPAIEWGATGTVQGVEPPPTGGNVFVFDEGLGTTYYWIPQLSDSGVELRDKVTKDIRFTGKVTNCNVKMYGYGPAEDIDVESMEAGTNSLTGPIPVPDVAKVQRTAKIPANCGNLMVHTIRIEGEWDGQGIRDRIDEVVYEQAVQGIRR